MGNITINGSPIRNPEQRIYKEYIAKLKFFFSLLFIELLENNYIHLYSPLLT